MEAGLPKMANTVTIKTVTTASGWSILLSLTLISLGVFRGPFQTSCFSSHSHHAALEIANLDSHGTSVICLGDSLTQGVGASLGHDYPTLLSQALGMPVINAGVDGDETTDALRRLEADVLAKDPKLVVVELGANDFMNGRPLKKAFENLDEIVRQIEAHGAMVVVVGIPPGPIGDTLQRGYDRIIQKHHVAFVPKILDGIFANPRLQNADHLHPNDAGYALMAERIRQTVIPLVKRTHHG